MTVFAVVFGLLVGGVVWETLDNIQQNTLSDIFRSELATVVDHRAREQLIRFQHHTRTYAALTRLLANHRRLSDYLEPRDWFPDDHQPPREYRGRQPPWLPDADRWQPPVLPSYLVLFDTVGNLREVYYAGAPTLSGKWREELGAYLMQSRLGVVLTVIEERPFALTSELVEDASGRAIGSLMLVVSIDEAFLNSVQGGPGNDTVTAVFDGDSRVALASSDGERLPLGASLTELEQRFAVTLQSFFDYEGADFNLQFGTLMPRNYLREVTSRVADLARRQRATAALVFVAVYSLLFTLVSNRLARALRRLADLSQRALGFTEPPRPSGNQLLVLEDWMRSYIRRVRDAREEMRARHETEMQVSTALTNAIMEASLDSIVTIDESGRIIEFNRTAERVFGHQRRAALGQDFLRLILDAASRDDFRSMLMAFQRSDSDSIVDVRTELSAIRHDGARFPVELAIKPIRLKGKSLFTVYLHDISERRRQEQEIRALAAFPSESPSPVLRINRPGVISYANDASEPLLRYWGCLRSQTLPLNWRMRIQEVLESGKPEELEIRVDDRFFSLLLAPIIELDYVNIYARDVTDARVAEAEARQHQTELVHVCRLSTMGEMATGMAHELNQPLSAIVNYANGSRRRLEAGQVTVDALKEPLNQISRQASRAAEIIRRLRALVSRQQAQRRNVDINAMVQEVLSFVDHEIRKFKVDVDVSFGKDLPPVRADLVQIEQVILNLIRNAIDAVKEKKPGARNLRLETSRSAGAGVEIRVEDNGPGVPPAVRQRLFEPFFSTKSTGMGMGLAISQTIAEDHGGKITTADRPGGGASFIFELPAFAQQETAIAV